jgi:methylenetetrahydrofolate--tRNA-(uracil-5-)-methyltransferase
VGRGAARRENAQGSLYNLVGFQTNLRFPEQKRVFSLIPGLENRSLRALA